MIHLHNIKAKRGAVKRPRTALGRGNATGHGTFSGHGCKGQKARSGGSIRPGFEGGQTPLMRRLPKLKGFRNPTRQAFQVVNVADLDRRYKDGEEVSFQTLLHHHLIREPNTPVKLLGDGPLTKKLTVKVHKISKSARAQIIAAGGKVI